MKRPAPDPAPVDLVLFIGCAGVWPLFTTVPFQSQEIVQFLLENLGRIPFKNKVDRTVALHDSCQVARIGTSELPRQLLRAIPGVTLVEMAHAGADALCCGGYTNTIHPEVSEATRRAYGTKTVSRSCSGMPVSRRYWPNHRRTPPPAV